MAKITSSLIVVLVAICMVSVAVPAAVISSQETEVTIFVYHDTSSKVKLDEGWEAGMRDNLNNNSAFKDAGFVCKAWDDYVTVTCKVGNETTCKDLRDWMGTALTRYAKGSYDILLEGGLIPPDNDPAVDHRSWIITKP